MATFTCYRPTPPERAHATYLLVTFFNTPVDMANDDGEMRVAGRDAVPFLTSVSDAGISCDIYMSLCFALV